jgi:hypothetical protein
MKRHKSYPSPHPFYSQQESRRGINPIHLHIRSIPNKNHDCLSPSIMQQNHWARNQDPWLLRADADLPYLLLLPLAPYDLSTFSMHMPMRRRGHSLPDLDALEKKRMRRRRQITGGGCLAKGSDRNGRVGDDIGLRLDCAPWKQKCWARSMGRGWHTLFSLFKSKGLYGSWPA